jgi:tetratricopeptide (TPR) repeat protein
MIRDLCKIYLSTGKTKAIDSLLTRELERYGDYPDLHYLQGQSWESQGLLERAFQSYQQAEALSAQQASGEKYVSEQGISTFRPLHRMGVIARQLGKLDEAARLFHRSLQHFPLYAPALLDIVTVFQRLDVPDPDIALLLRQLVPADQAAGRAAIIEALYAADAFEAICGLPQEIVRPEKDTLLRIVSAWVLTGELKTAETVIRESKLWLTSLREDQELLRELWKLETLCGWGQGKPLREEQLAGIPEPQRSGWQWIDRRLAQKAAECAVSLDSAVPLESTVSPDNAASLDSTASPEYAESPESAELLAFSTLLAEFICLSVKLHLYVLATALAQLTPGHQTELAAALYKEGCLEEAGELFIELAHDERTAQRVAFYIGEMLFDKGHYGEAAGWFQQALEEPVNEAAARTGLSVCYLQLAVADLENAVNSLGGEYTHGPVLEDIAAVRNAIILLNRTPWHTVWSYRSQQGGTSL